MAETSPPTDDIRAFCEQTIRKKKLQAEFVARARPKRKVKADALARMEKYLSDKGVRSAIARAHLDGGATVLHLAIKRSVTQRRVTPEVIEAGVDAYLDSLQGQPPPDDPEELASQLCEHINAMRTSASERLSVSYKAIKGAGHPQDLSDALGDQARAYLTADKQLKQWSKVKKDRMQQIQESIGRHGPVVSTFLAQKGVNFQRVALRDGGGRQVHYIREKIHRRKPTLKVADVRRIALESVNKVLSEGTDNLCGTLKQQMIQLFTAEPSTEKRVLCLDKAAAPRTEHSTIDDPAASSVDTRSVFDE